MTGLERVVTAAQAGEIINHMAGRDAPCGPEAGTEAAQRLVGFYPAREVNDAKSYVAGMSALLASAPLDFVRRVVDPVHGLPTRLKWLPTLADVREALDAEKARRERIWANARWIISQAEERERKAREAAEYEANRPDLEARRKIVESALKPFPTPHKAA